MAFRQKNRRNCLEDEDDGYPDTEPSDEWDGMLYRERDGPDEPGLKFAYRLGKKKPNSKPNGYEEFVKRKAKLDGVPYSPDLFATYSGSWNELSEEDKEVYKNGINFKSKVNDKVHPETLPDASEWDVLNEFREIYGSDLMGEEMLTRLIYHPAYYSDLARGREVPEDLQVVHALYTLLEDEQRNFEEAMMLDLRSLLGPDNSAGTPIFVINCIPLSRSADPTTALNIPLEIYLSWFHIKGGVSDFGYHRFLSTPADVLAPLPFGSGRSNEYKEKAEKLAWLQAQQRHMLPYDGFDPTDRRYSGEYQKVVEDQMRGWAEFARKEVDFTNEYSEVLDTILSMMEQFVDDQGKLPPLFTRLKDRDMVSDCLLWLGKECEKIQLPRNEEHEKSQRIPKVYSLEHLAWHLADVLEFQCTESYVEQALGFRDYLNGDVRCSYHETCPSKVECARATVLCDIQNMTDLLDVMYKNSEKDVDRDILHCGTVTEPDEPDEVSDEEDQLEYYSGSET